ncbi:MAG: Phosphopantothenoylcysteine synthase/decarboxylase [Berkelbacteria bacterium GW2011_GWA1_36_9]|uniref:Phosphopantothenoylcysteine synthase/decarboxylase n=1 Tax=Berkelbacteria bacterium GW2011_GWA1_36_9 TaxID=1618331 RepID=A0A0G0I0L9_9BACT|nr:MAG: Phosphopantothenoylcysteine synthase/decarboxylase [Berkelbacteria bacterium GW2011_GWA1_36_9]
MKKILNRKRILITAGPVWVPIDKVRIITSIFGGVLGAVMAEEAQKLGANVLLMMGPGRVNIQSGERLKIVRFKYFKELFDLMKKEVSSEKYDVVIHSAAVPDYIPEKIYNGKIKSGKNNLIIKLKPTVKIIDHVKKWDPSVCLVKFKLQVGKQEKELIKIAKKSMVHSKADVIVANDLLKMKDKTHKAFIISENGSKKVNTKDNLAKELLKIIGSEISV